MVLNCSAALKNNTVGVALLTFLRNMDSSTNVSQDSAKASSAKVTDKNSAIKTLFSALKKDARPFTKNLTISKKDLAKKVSTETNLESSAVTGIMPISNLDVLEFDGQKLENGLALLESRHVELVLENHYDDERPTGTFLDQSLS